VGVKVIGWMILEGNCSNNRIKFNYRKTESEIDCKNMDGVLRLLSEEKNVVVIHLKKKVRNWERKKLKDLKMRLSNLSLELS
jgi:hypothetical protein